MSDSNAQSGASTTEEVLTADLPIGRFTEMLSAQTSTPGGGGSAAIAGAMAASLVSMVINFTVGKKKYAEVETEFRSHLEATEALRQELLALADADVAAFTAVTAAYAMPKESDAEKAARTEAMQVGLKQAARIPFVTAEKCLAVIQRAEPVGAKGNPNVVSDAATAVYLAYAAMLAGIANVNINLKSIKDEVFVAEWAAEVAKLQTAAEAARASALAACSQTLGVAL
jgi:formiminotetrahydrofolate cyclodeaminase